MKWKFRFKETKQPKVRPIQYVVPDYAPVWSVWEDSRGNYYVVFPNLYGRPAGARRVPDEHKHKFTDQIAAQKKAMGQTGAF